MYSSDWIEEHAKTMQPLKDRVILMLKPVDRKTAGGIWIPDSAKSIRVNRATVMAVGKGEWLEIAGRYREPEVQPGNEVLFHDGAGVYLDEKKQWLNIRECDIMAIIEPDANVRMDSKYDVEARDIV